MENKNLLLPDYLAEGAQAGLDLAAALEKARKAANALASTSSRVKRVLAGFDQINRLGEKKKSAASRKSSSKKEEAPVQEPVVQQPQSSLTLKQIFDGLETAVLEKFFQLPPGLVNAISTVRQVGQQLYATWQNEMIPVGQWINGTLIPTVGQYLGEGFQNALMFISGFGTQLSQIWQLAKAETSQMAQSVGQSLLGFGTYFDSLVLKIFGGSQQIGSSADAMSQQVGTATGNVMTELGTLQGVWSGISGNFQAGISAMTAGTVGALQSVTGYLRGSFSQEWQDGFSALKTPAKGAFNGVIGFMNKLLGGMGSTCNGMVDIVNKLKIKIPDWVPGIGGKQYGFSLKTVSAPQIPYLAKGAVLPANQPFLAVVGDQKHGTNVEAPLATIQDAMAQVMADHTAGNMAGHEATVAVLNRILEAVLGIDVGEAVIARAAQSYRMKEAVMKGGGF